ncbi:hypothetical protein SAMN06265365_101699 [Tistlia consotensis]|uniref:Uncharacterized protein n=1 Tax=Tistlia consotensis USBA 355 TaxID=560819 RepID=A0A1Y6B6G1_9PROT|nr:hypothetical protein [Tistlia consotensis]SME94645.1 hypothetical protein SAMN05428998_101698 [Tistlia consotensis USBA 355]SNR29457.1 hypothetical protein SAMN06265365_101699 [Tistlia consotensis]
MAGKLPDSGRRPGDGTGEVLLRIPLNRAKARALLATHFILPALILYRVVEGQGPLRESLVALLVVGSVFGFAAWSVIRELRTPGPAVVLEREGFRDFRRGDELVPWEQVSEVSLKRGILSRGVKIVLTDGNRADIDTGLLDIRARKLTERIVDLLHERQAGDAEEEES